MNAFILLKHFTTLKETYFLMSWVEKKSIIVSAKLQSNKKKQGNLLGVSKSGKPHIFTKTIFIEISITCCFPATDISAFA